MLGHPSSFATDMDPRYSSSSDTDDSVQSLQLAPQRAPPSLKSAVGVISSPKLSKSRLNTIATSVQGPFSAPATSSSAFSFFHPASPLSTNPPTSVASNAASAAATLAAESSYLYSDGARNSTSETYAQSGGLADILLGTPKIDKLPPTLNVPQHHTDLYSPIASSPFNYSQLPTPNTNSQMQNTLGFSQLIQEEITTIFVVGFPDDMYEREFQNMFIFCPGFEAATLKVPSSSEINEDNSANGRKQIIGFAKFRTRADALDARNILSGRKVDAERGCVLKAEMAKKNLHTKRGLSNEAPVPTTQSFTGTLNQVGRRPPPPGFGGIQTKDSMFTSDAFNAYLGSPPQIPRDLLASPEFSPYEGIDNNYLEEQNAVAHAQAQLEEQQQQLQKQQNLQNQQQQQQQLVQQLQQQQQQQQQHLQQQSPQTSSIQRLTSPSSYSEANYLENTNTKGLFSDILDLRSASQNLSVPTRPTFLEQHVDSPLLSSSMDQFEGSALQRAHSLSSVPDRGFNSALYHNDSLLHQRMSDLRINTSFGMSGITSPLSGLSSMITPNNGSPLTPLSSYPFRTGADQNPPCNTLYVGNLPPNTQEQELLQLFSRSVGFKRLLFRSRPNGPMCFVEFDDINCAAHALNNLSGSQLSNSTKGGIRLSYSKNPLGVRQNPTPSTPTSQQLLSPHLYLESRLIHGH